MIGVLGPLELDGKNPALSPRDRVVLQALALRQGHAVPGGDLAEALWGDDRPASAAKVLQGAVMRLRRRLGAGAVERVGDGYRLTSDQVTDIGEFERLVARARSLTAAREPARAYVAYDEALLLWRGAPYPELRDWPPAVDESTRLVALQVAVREERLAAALDSGRAAEVALQAQRLVRDDPYRETGWYLYASALFGLGRQAEALTVLRRARTVLREELGLSSSPMLAELEQAVLRQDPSLPRARRSVASPICPYPGLSPFQAGDADLFVGREDDVEACVRRLAGSPLLAVVGPSGSGKSSLARAGLVPAFERAGHAVTVVTPGPDPVGSLRAARAAVAPGTALVVDQLEELIVPGTDHDVVVDYLDAVAGWAATGPVVLTLRADHLGAVPASEALSALVEKGLHLLAPPDVRTLRRIIDEPARRSGLVLEAGLTDLLLRDVAGQPGALPLLAHALRSTWQARDGDVLTVEGYLGTGAIAGAVARTADQVFASLTEHEQAVLRSLMLRLVPDAPGGQPVCVRVPVSVLQGRDGVAPVLRRFVDARLLTLDGSTVGVAHESLAAVWPRLRTWLEEDVDGRRVLRHLQVAAEGWALNGRPGEDLYRGPRLAVALEWRERERPVLGAEENAFLSASVHAQDAERSAQRAQLTAQRAQNRRLRRALVTVAALLVVTAAAAGVTGRAVVAAGRAERETAAAQLGAVAAAEPRADTALLLSRQAVALADTPQTSANLLAALDARRDLTSLQDLGLVGYVGAQTFASAAGDRVLSLQLDGAHLVDPATGAAYPGAPLIADDRVGALYAAGFTASPATAWLTVARGEQCELAGYDAATGVLREARRAVPGSRCGDFFTMDRIRIAPDGGHLVSVVGDRLRVWTRTSDGWSGPEVSTVPGLEAGFPVPRSVTFDRAGRRAVAVVDRTGQAPWYRFTRVVVPVDVSRGAVVGPPLVDDDVSAAALSPDGDVVAVARHSGPVEARPFGSLGLPGATAAAGRLVTDGSSSATAVSWSPDGASIAVGRADGSVDVVPSDGGGVPVVERGHADAPDLVAFTADGEGLLSLDTAGLALVWSVAPPAPATSSVTAAGTAVTGPGAVRPGALGPVRDLPRPHAVVIGTGAGPVAVGLEDGRIRLLDPVTLADDGPVLDLGRSLGTDPTQDPAAHRRVTALAITADGGTLVAGDRAGHLRAWALPERRLLWSRDDAPTAFLAVSPDGRTLATAEFDHPDGEPSPDPAPKASRVVLRDLGTGQVRHVVDTEARKPRTVVFSPDSRRVVAGFFEAGALVLDIADGRTVATLDLDVSAATFTPDGDGVLIVGFGGLATVVDATTWSPGSTFRVPVGYTHATYSRDGEFLFVATDRTTQIWDARRNRLLVKEFSLRGDATNDALFLAVPSDFHGLFVGSQSQLTRIDLRQAVWEDVACRVSGRDLTVDEKDRYLPGRTVSPTCGS